MSQEDATHVDTAWNSTHRAVDLLEEAIIELVAAGEAKAAEDLARTISIVATDLRNIAALRKCWRCDGPAHGLCDV